MTRRSPDAKKTLSWLTDPGLGLSELSQRLGASEAAVDEARALLEEIETAESDAILAMPPILARALLLAAVRADRLGLLQEAAEAEDKEIRKEARRLAHSLRSSGTAIELPEPKAEPVIAPAAGPREELPALLSSIAPNGAQRVFWTRRLPEQGIELADVSLVEDGIASFQAVEVSRKRFRKLVSTLPEERGSARLFVAPRDDARRLLDLARVRARDGGTSPPDFGTWSVQALGAIPDETPEPLGPRDDGRAPDDDAERNALVSRSSELFSEPEIAWWWPEEESMQRVALRIQEAGSSALFLPGQQGELQREEAMSAAIEREVEAYFDDTRRQRYADRLSATARLFELDGRPEAARIAHATALRLRSDGNALEIPFCRMLFMRGFRQGAEAAPGEAEEKPTSPLLITP